MTDSCPDPFEEPDFGEDTPEEVTGQKDLKPMALSLEQAKALLAEKHNTTLEVDDPLLLLVTLHQAFLGDYELILSRRDQLQTDQLRQERRVGLALMQKFADEQQTKFEEYKKAFEEKLVVEVKPENQGVQYFLMALCVFLLILLTAKLTWVF